MHLFITCTTYRAAKRETGNSLTQTTTFSGITFFGSLKGLSTRLGPWGLGLIDYEITEALWTNSIKIPNEVKEIRVLTQLAEVLLMRQSFRVRVQLLGSSVPIQAKLVKIQLVSKAQGSNGFLSRNVNARSDEHGIAQFTVAVESGKDGEYAFSFLSVSDGFQSPITSYFYAINPIGHIAIVSQLLGKNDTVVRTKTQFPQYLARTRTHTCARTWCHNFCTVPVPLKFMCTCTCMDARSYALRCKVPQLRFGDDPAGASV